MREIRNMEELKMAQIELKHKIEITQMQLQAQKNAIKEILNPMTYVKLAVSKLASLESIAISFFKGYRTVKEMIAKYRNRNNASESQTETQTGDQMETQMQTTGE